MLQTLLQKIALLALAGALGTLARYGISTAVARVSGSEFPWGTLAVNVLGCLAAGLLLALFDARSDSLTHHHTILMVGFLGSFTTFSAFMADTGDLIQSATTLRAAANIVLHNALGIAAFFCGLGIGRHLSLW